MSYYNTKGKVRDFFNKVMVYILIASMIFTLPHLPSIYASQGKNKKDIATESEAEEIKISDEDINADKELDLGENIDSLEADGFKYIIKDGKATIVGLSSKNKQENIHIPATIAGFEVSEIGDRAFYFNNIKSIEFEENSSLTKIGAYAFAGNNIESIDLPESLENIGEAAFRDNQIEILDLKNTLNVEKEAFINNKLEELKLGDKIESLGDGAFKNNNLVTVKIPATLTQVGEKVFSYNNRFVKLIVDNEEDLHIPSLEKERGAYGYVVNPIVVKISFIDKETGVKLLDDINVGEDLAYVDEAFVKGREQSYIPRNIPGYKPVLEEGRENIVFTPTTDIYNLEVQYEKVPSDISLEKATDKKYIIPAGTNEEEVKTLLKSFVVARDKNGEDLIDKVEIMPNTLDTSREDRIEEVNYRLVDEKTGEEKNITLKVYIGTDMKNFPIGNDWKLGDFIYGSSYDTAYIVVGLSESGKTKAENNRNLVLPHINPETGDRITEVNTGYDYLLSEHNGQRFKEADFETIEDYDANIERVENQSFEELRKLRKVNLPNLKNVGPYAFNHCESLEEFTFDNVETVSWSSFSYTGLKKVIAPKLHETNSDSFSYSKLGGDPTYPQGIYLPNLEEVGNSSFSGNLLTYLDDSQFPNLKKIGGNAFSSNKIANINLPKVKEIQYSAFSSQMDLPEKVEVNFPELVNLDNFALYGMGITKLKAPKLEMVGTGAVGSNKLSELDLPELREAGETSFDNNIIEKVNTPKIRIISDYAFAGNKIKELNMPDLQVIGKNAFGRKGSRNFPLGMAPAYNPGMRTLGYFIPIYTNNNEIPSKENYIINPRDNSEDSTFEENDFTWDSENPNKVTGFTTKGKQKIIAREFILDLPDKTTEIANDAFISSNISKVRGKNVTKIGDYAFRENPLKEAKFPSLTEVGAFTFANNEADNGKLKSFDFSHVTKIGEGSFDGAGLEGTLDIPLLEKVAGQAFQSNSIKRVNAPLVKEIESYAFASGTLESIDREQFPVLESLEWYVFYNNPNIRKIDLPSLKYSEGNGEFLGIQKVITWIVPANIRNKDDSKTSFGSSTFSYVTPNNESGINGRPGGIILTEEPNPDGTLKRINAAEYKETIEDFTYYANNNSNEYISTKARTAVINPSTVKVKFRTEDNKEFDGLEDRPLRKDYREYLYEELDVDKTTKQWQESKKYAAPYIEGYVCINTIDDKGNNTNNAEVDLPYEKEGERTDREITFIYRKITREAIEGPKVLYGLVDDEGEISLHSKTYMKYDTYSKDMPQMNTSFTIDEVKKPIKKGKIKINFASPYIDLDEVNVAKSDTTRTWYKDDAISVRDGEVEIDLNENISPSNSIRTVDVAFKFKYRTPKGAKAILTLSLLDEDENGNEVLIGKPEPVELKLDYGNSHSIMINSPLDTSRKEFIGMYDWEDGPRYMGDFESTPKGNAIVANPDYTVFNYSFGSDTGYDIDKLSLNVPLPKYTAIENGEEVIKTAVFDKLVNPEWVLSEDGTRISFVKEFEPVYSLYYLSSKVPSLYLKFPGMKEGTKTVNKVYGKIRPAKLPIEKEQYEEITLTGDLSGVVNPDLSVEDGDSLTINPIPLQRRIPSGDTGGLKINGDSPRTKYVAEGRATVKETYLYDNEEDREKNLSYDLSIGSENETTDFTNVAIIDYDLDSRLRYSELKFLDDSYSVGNRAVKVEAFKKRSTKIDPDNDELLFEQEAYIEKGNSIIFPKVDIDYVKISILGTENVPMNKFVNFTMETKIKNPSISIYDSIDSDKNLLKNKAIMIGYAYPKGSNARVQTKGSGEFSNISANFILQEEASIKIYPYEKSMAVNKYLKDRYNMENFKTFPSTSEGTAIEGQEGSYYIGLSPYTNGISDDNGFSEIINNLEVVDVVPEAININKDDVVLHPLFEKAGGEFKIVDDYITKENGTSVKRKAIIFSAKRFNMQAYDKNRAAGELPIAAIKAKYISGTSKSILKNRVYATWDNSDIEILNVAKTNDKFINSHEEELAQANRKYSYSEADISVSSSSALVSHEWIRNKTDNIWQDQVPTGSQEEFDYKILVANYDRKSASKGYTGLDIIDVLPENNDLKLNKQGSRGSDFSNSLDLSRINELVAPTGYTITYLNTDETVVKLLSNRTMDDLVEDSSLTWQNSPATNTKMIRIKADEGTKLLNGERLEIHIPMKAPKLNGLEDSLVGKKAVNSFVIRYHNPNGKTYGKFAEPNSVYNYMTLPKGSISFTKYGKEGDATSTDQAFPLEGAAFQLIDAKTNKILATRYSGSDGKVKFDNIDIKKNYKIVESLAPQSYTASTYVAEVSAEEIQKATNYDFNLGDKYGAKYFVNVKPVRGKIKIIKEARDGLARIPNIAFNIRGGSSTNSNIDIKALTDRNGILVVDDLPDGWYSVTELETTAANRYEVAPSQSLVISNTDREPEIKFVNDRFRVLFRKIVVEDENIMNPNTWDELTDFGNKKLSGYKFKVVGSDNTEFATDYTDEKGEVSLTNLRTGIDYTVTELPTEDMQNENKDLYAHNPREYKFRISHTGTLVNALNDKKFKQYALNIPNLLKPIKGEITIKKISNEKPAKPLEGAEFGIYKLGYGEDGKVNNREFIAKKSTILENGEAIAKFDNLQAGNYEIKELKAPLGYELNSKPIEVIIPSEAKKEANFEYRENDIIYRKQVEVLNRKLSVKGIKGSEIEGYKNISLERAKLFIKEHKTDMPNLKYRELSSDKVSIYEPLAGVKFELYKLENGIKVGAPITIGNSSEIITDENGNIDFADYKFDFDAEYGLYEKESIDGYVKYEGVKRFKLSEEATKVGFNGEYNFYFNNRKEEGSIIISKYDAIKKQSIAGAIFELYKGDKNTANFDVPIKVAQTKADGIVYFGNLELGKYVVREKIAPEGYKLPKESDTEIDITSANKTVRKIIFNSRFVNVDIIKNWSGGSEASVKVRLLRKTATNTKYEPVKTEFTDENGIAILSENNFWKASYIGLDKVDENGNLYTYKAEELGLDNGKYKATITGDFISEDEAVFNITNTATSSNKVSIGVTKVWDMGIGADIPEDAKVQLILKKVLDGSASPARDSDITEIVDTYTLTKTDAWQHTFTDLPKRENGKDIVYRVEEASNFEGFITENTYDEENSSFKITNKAITRNVEVEKLWQGVDKEKAPEIILDLYDKDREKVLASKVPSIVDDKLIVKFENIPSYTYTVDENGNIISHKIEYKVDERYIDGNIHPGYVKGENLASISYDEYAADENISTKVHFTLENIRKYQDIRVKKNWKGIAKDFAPEVKVRLYERYENDGSINYNPLSDEIILNKDNNFETIIQNIPMYKEDGQTEINYELKELGLENNLAYKLSENKLIKDDKGLGFELTNTKESIKAKITKTWDDFSAYNRPTVKFDLLADKTDDGIDNPIFVQEFTIDSTESWTKSLDLDRYTDDGKTLIKYYIKEKELAGYEVPKDKKELVLNKDTGILEASLHNILKTKTILVEKKWENLGVYPISSIDNLPDIHVRLLDISNENKPRVIRESVSLRGENGIWKASFENLPIYKEDGISKIKYSVEEVETKDGILKGYIPTYSTLENSDDREVIEIVNRPRLRNITISKRWQVTPEESSIKVHLLKNGEELGGTIEISKNSSTPWKYKIEGLPYYEIDGKTKINYSIIEEKVAGYEPSISLIDEENDGLLIDLNNLYRPALSIGGTGRNIIRQVSKNIKKEYKKPDVQIVRGEKDNPYERREKEKMKILNKVIPKTGDDSRLALYVVLLLLSATGLVLAGKKKKEK